MLTTPDFHHILIVEDETSKRAFCLTEKHYTIGRDITNNITITEPQVSRYHATLIKVEVEVDNPIGFFYTIIDGDLEGNKSTNGLIINGKSCTEHSLRHGDNILFGGKSYANYYIVSNPAMISFLITSPSSNKTTNIEQFTKTTVPSEDYLEIIKNNDQQDLIRLASFPELNPTPIIEINYQGKITYLNAAAILRFSDIYQSHNKHPILANLLEENSWQQGKLIVREIEIGEEFFHQYIHYLTEQKLIRSYIFDMTQKREIEKALQETEARYRSVVKQIYEGILLVDVKSQKIIEVNEAYCNLVKYTEQELYQLNLNDLIYYPEHFSGNLEKVVNNKVDFCGESIHKCKDNTLLDVEVSVTLITYHDQEVFCLTVRDITQKKKDQELLQYQAFYDALTGLPNRVFFQKSLDDAIADAASNNYFLAVIFLDIDEFKKINDSFGHDGGDELLKSFAHRLKSCLRSCDLVGRWGGDEFTILISQFNQLENLTKLALRILASFEKPLQIFDCELKITSSLGIAVYPSDGLDTQTLLKNADAALYQAKEEGKNKYRFYQTNVTFGISKLTNLDALLAEALVKEQLSLCYQLRVNIKTRKIIGIEAFIQWQHPDKGLVSGEELLGLIEETKQTIKIADWLIKAVCQQNQIWQTSGLAPITISIALSLRQFQQSQLTIKIAKVLAETQLPPNLLELVINKANIGENFDLSAQILTKLSNQGITISLDDFSLIYFLTEHLEEISIDNLKINQSLIKQMEKQKHSRKMISAIIAWAKALNIKIVAMGIEEPTQVNLLTTLECEVIQGNLWGAFLNIQQVTELLHHGLD